MKLYSNNLLKYNIPIPDDAIIRVNLAWTDTRSKLIKILRNPTHKLFIDYPMGRKKHPFTQIAFGDAINLCNRSSWVHYFAISNAENPDSIEALRYALNQRITLVPKIETRKGIENIKEIVQAAKTDIIMFYKNDLWIDVDRNLARYLTYLDNITKTCSYLNVKMLVEQGIIFL